jgi:hypothetical protein
MTDPHRRADLACATRLGEGVFCGIQQVNGTLTATGPRFRTDAQTFAAAYSGSGQASSSSGQAGSGSGQAGSGSGQAGSGSGQAGSGSGQAGAGDGVTASGQASGTFRVRWRQGQSVAYGAAFYLPTNFHTAPTGQQALLRWDSVTGPAGRSQQGGVVIDYSDNAGYLVTATVAKAQAPEASGARAARSWLIWLGFLRGLSGPGGPVLKSFGSYGPFVARGRVSGGARSWPIG